MRYTNISDFRPISRLETVQDDKDSLSSVEPHGLRWPWVRHWNVVSYCKILNDPYLQNTGAFIA